MELESAGPRSLLVLRVVLVRSIFVRCLPARTDPVRIMFEYHRLISARKSYELPERLELPAEGFIPIVPPVEIPSFRRSRTGAARRRDQEETPEAPATVLNLNRLPDLSFAVARVIARWWRDQAAKPTTRARALAYRDECRPPAFTNVAPP